MNDKNKLLCFTPTFENGGYWEYYRDLERQFENFSESVPYLSGNENTYSFRLANLILAIGAHIDSAFKEMARYPEFSTKYPLILKKESGEPRNPTIRDYYDLAVEYKLPQRKVMFKRLPEREQVIPFQQFVKVKDKIMTPDWWHVYNNVKHHFSENFEKANLKNIRDILAGAFLLNIVHVPAYLRLIEYGVVKSGYTMKVSFTLNTGWQERVKELIRKNKSLGNIETALFSYDYRKEDESLASSDFPQ
jgi:hypothetical protein